MKKIFLLVSALILTAACGAPSTNEPVKPANTSAEKPAPAPVTEADAIAKEKAIWDTIKNKDYAAFGNTLADDETEVTPEAIADKAGSTAMVKDFEPSEVTFSDWKFMSIDKDAFLVTYTVAVKGKYKGKEIPAAEGSARASSAWANRGGKWLAVYHQECPVKPPAKAAPKEATTPAATQAMPTAGPDAIANEKMVWDTFKTKNYDGFAALLDASFIEVEPDGVYDKAGAVKGIIGFDVSKAELSDWKSFKIDDNASLVTYTFKMAGAAGDGERHSTIWAKRDGKWSAVLHHGGTTVMKPPPSAAKEMPAQPVKAPAK
jgi:hypothetical protein